MTRLLHELLLDTASRDAQAPAVDDGTTTESYEQLDRAASSRAALLCDEGARRGDRVAVRMSASHRAVAWVHAVLRSGGCYVPVDPRAPIERLQYVLGDCGVTTLVWDEADHGGVDRARAVLAGTPPLERVLVEGVDGRVRVLRPGADDEEVSLDGREQGTGPVPVIEDDLACILYTSGSTGSPKGVMLTHRNMVAFVEWAAAEVELASTDRLVNHAPFHFDLSVFDLFAASLVGATTLLVPPSARMFPRSLGAFVVDSAATVLYVVPSVLVSLVDAGQFEDGAFSQLRLVMFGGEVIAPRHLHQFMSLAPKAAYYNLYGPTESNACTYYRVPPLADPQPEAIPIGLPCPHLDVLVLDDDGTPVAPGEVGELHVRGPAVTPGYWGDPERTRAAFSDLSGLGRHAGGTYRTGDMVRLDGDGLAWFVGRRDLQVKRRGHRIEPAEIEAALLRHEAVRECAVVAVRRDGVLCLTAVVAGSGPASATELWSHCASLLPRSLFPDDFRFVESLPKTSSGKIDRERLRQEVEAVGSHD